MPIGAAIGGAVATVGGAVLGANAAGNAADTAAGAQRDASAANVALARETYAQNASRLDPTINSGLTAGNAIMGLLGYPQSNTTAGGTGPIPTRGPEPVAPTPDGLGSGGLIQRSLIQQIQSGATVDPERLARHGLTDYANQYRTWRTSNAATGQPVTAGNAMSAFDTFRDSSGYKFRLDQGVQSIQQGMGALGAFDSGATRKALTEYGQNFASNELGTYMDRLAQQQGFGLSGASALAGVSQNMAGMEMNANNNAASAAGNAALVRGQATSNMYGQVAGALGGLASSFSDRRLKRNIEKVGEYPNGLGKYRWVYTFDPDGTVYEGVMADEVKEIAPAAYSEDVRGYGMVNYALLPA